MLRRSKSRPLLIRGLMAGLISLLAGCATPPSSPGMNSATAPSAEAERALEIAHVMRDNGQVEAAVQVYERMDQRHQLHGPWLLEYATLAARVRPPAQALALFQRADQQLEQADKPDASARFALCLGRGRAALALGRLDQARQAMQCALQIEPGNPAALNGLGVISDLEGHNEAAEQYFREALEIDPGNTAAANNLALSLLAAGDPQAAIARLETLRPQGHPSIWLNLALAQVMAGNDDLAHALLDQRLSTERAAEVLADFRATRRRIDAGAAAPRELLAASQRPLALMGGN